MTNKLNQTPQPELSERDADLLSAYIDKMLSDAELRDLEARLETDAFLRRELVAMRQTVAWMNALPTLKAPRDFTISEEDVAENIPIPERNVIPMQNRSWWYIGSAAAIFIVLMGVLIFVPISQNASPSAGDAQEAVAIQSTSEGSSTEIVAYEITTSQAETQAELVTTNAEQTAVNDPTTFLADGVVDDETTTSARSVDADEAAEQNTNNLQAPIITSDFSEVQLTATSIAQIFDASPTQVSDQADTFGQGAGAASAPSAEQAPDVADDSANTAAMVLNTATAVPTAIAETLNNADGVESEAEAIAEADIEEASDDDMADEVELDDADVSEGAQESAQDDGASNVDDNVSTSSNTTANDGESESINLISAYINAMRAYIEGLRP